MQRALELQERRAREEKEHLEHMARLDALIAEEKQRVKDARLTQQRAKAVQQKEVDLAKAKAFDPQRVILPPPISNPRAAPISTDATSLPQQSLSTEPEDSPESPELDQSTSAANISSTKDQRGDKSAAKIEWERQKKFENASNDAIDPLMEMIGLEEVKLQILRIKAKIDVSVRQNSDMKEDRLNVVFLGNPGTGRIRSLSS